MILVFDTYSGLCNQMIDIRGAIHFSLEYKIYFTFRYSCNRNIDNLTKFNKVEFNTFFDEDQFSLFDFYIPFKNLKDEINENNTYNYSSKRSIELWGNKRSNDELFEFIKNIETNEGKKYIVITQFMPLYKYGSFIIPFALKHIIIPSQKIMKIYLKIRNNLLNQPYNFIHYRYENDFVNHFRISELHKLDTLIENIEFKTKNIPIYIGLSKSQLKKGIHYDNEDIFCKKIITKDNIIKDLLNENLNYEECAFIDFLIGTQAEEVYGHSKSSFSMLLNGYNDTNNQYDKIIF